MFITPSTELNAAERMDQQYRYQRYVYDWSRKYYLLGRDSLLNDIVLQPDANLLEIGCGTGSNLLQLQRRYPQHALYGVDASELMLEQARAKFKHLAAPTVHLQQGLAQDVSLASLKVEQGFDHIVFSYVLSMIPEWRLAFEHSLTLLKPHGTLHIVDFSDQAELPKWVRRALKQWLAWFNVHPDPQVPEYLSALAQPNSADLALRYVWGRYALLAHYTPRSTLL